MRIERFEDIEAWQLARELTRKFCGLTKNNPEPWSPMAPPKAGKPLNSEPLNPEPLNLERGKL
ncbi:MAG: hypothetical protein JRD05_12320 [Deltaproteobacteria bacterium]|nr:hypothetical protein [Deltaproteobacteria bacterium]